MIQDAIDILGHKVNDKVTGFSGIATSVCFDLYGCVQVIINPGLDEKGKPQETFWFDVNRLNVSEETVMKVPDFDLLDKKPETYDHGPAEKPAMSRI